MIAYFVDTVSTIRYAIDSEDLRLSVSVMHCLVVLVSMYRGRRG